MVLVWPPIQIFSLLHLLGIQHLYRQKQECRALKHSQPWQLQLGWTQQLRAFLALCHRLARREWISRVCQRRHNSTQQAEGLLHRNLDFRIRTQKVLQYRNLRVGTFLQHLQQIFLTRVHCLQLAVMS
tara:strand:+ start:157 stop:540 length:384 start_codon:yes stop_codon:yes gene_type:complete